MNASLSRADDFDRPMQELVTEYCWNEIWNRPGLDRKARSMINLAMITALNRPHELKVHVRGAINNGLTKAEITEIFCRRLSIAAYRRRSTAPAMPRKSSRNSDSRRRWQPWETRSCCRRRR